MASRGINKVIILGNLGQDPVISQGSTGNTVANISVATSIVWIDKQTGDKSERTEWHRVVFFAKLAEIVQQYLRKGSKVYIEGSLRTEKWTDNAGQERYTTKIIAREMQMLDSKKDFVDSSPAQATSTPAQSVAPSPEFEDDIPF